MSDIKSNWILCPGSGRIAICHKYARDPVPIEVATKAGKVYANIRKMKKQDLTGTKGFMKNTLN